MKSTKTSNWFFFIMYFVYRLRYGFFALLLGVGAFFLYNYWQDLTRDANDLHLQAGDGMYRVDFYYPDKIGVNQEAEAEITVDALSTLHESEEVTAEFKIYDEYAYFDPKVKSITIDDVTKTSGRVKVKIGYRNPLIPPSQPINFEIIIKTSGSDLPLTGSIRVDSTSKQVITFATTVLMALGAVLQFAIQLKELFFKKG